MPVTSAVPAIRILAEAHLRQCVHLDLDALEAVAEAFSWLAHERVTMPPILHLEVPSTVPSTGRAADEGHAGGDVDIKTAAVRGLDRFAVKIAAGFYDNPSLGLPSGSGMMVVLSARTGFPIAVLLDNGYLTDIRTALAGAVAARHLAPATVRRAGVLGTGAQARLQIEALQLVRPFERLIVWGRDPSKAGTFQREMQERLGVPVDVAATAEDVVRQSQCVITATPSRAPLIQADWLHPGLHITSMGSDGPGKQELDPAVLLRADHVVCDRLAQSTTAGELQHLDPAQRPTVVELGVLTSGQQEGRSPTGAIDEHAITVCDLTGTGVQDTAIACFALDQAARLSLGHTGLGNMDRGNMDRGDSSA